MDLGQKEKGKEYLGNCLNIAREIQDSRMEELVRKLLEEIKD